MVTVATVVLWNLGCAANEPPVRSPACESSARWSGEIDVDEGHVFLAIRGDDCDAPVLLWLHGGPGGAERPLFRLYNRDLERRFVVAYWDQRGAGRSYDPDADVARLTVAQHLRDLERVVSALRERLRKQQVVLVGHSWGAALGLLYAKQHPDEVAALVAVAPLIGGRASQEAQREFVQTSATRAGDEKSLAKLADIGEPPFAGNEMLQMQSLVDRFGGYFHRRPSFLAAMMGAFIRGYVAPWEIPGYIRANNVSLDAMAEELATLDLRERVRSVETPVVFMLGRHDRQADSRLAAAYFEALGAPRKSLLWFEESAHNVPFEQPEQFNARLADVLAELGIE